LEILNEPCIGDSVRWNSIQQRAIEAVRRSAPEHTIIASGDDCSQIPELLKLDPPTDRNVIYNFHLYDPIAFTHQGASWSPPWAMKTKGLVYPTDRVNVLTLLNSAVDEKARAKLVEYWNKNWSAPAYQSFLEPALTWSRQYGVALTCNEFGVYTAFAPRPSRVKWIADIASLLTNSGIGWTMWDYAGSFAVVGLEGGKRVPDLEITRALGLT
jgi:endoglucanase